MGARSSAIPNSELTGCFDGEKCPSSALIPDYRTPTAGPAKALAGASAGVRVLQGSPWQFGLDEARVPPPVRIGSDLKLGTGTSVEQRGTEVTSEAAVLDNFLQAR